MVTITEGTVSLALPERQRRALNRGMTYMYQVICEELTGAEIDAPNKKGSADFTQHWMEQALSALQKHFGDEAVAVRSELMGLMWDPKLSHSWGAIGVEMRRRLQAKMRLD